MTKIQVSSYVGESQDVTYADASGVQKYIGGHQMAFGVLKKDSIKLKDVANNSCKICISDEKDSHAGLIISIVSSPRKVMFIFNFDSLMVYLTSSDPKWLCAIAHLVILSICKKQKSFN